MQFFSRGIITDELVREMHTSSERDIVKRLNALKGKKPDELKEIEMAVRADVKVAMQKSMTPDNFKFIFDLIDATPVKIDRFACKSMCGEELLGPIVSFLRCRVLFDVFLMTYFAPEEKSLASLVSYYNYAKTREGFVYELNYMYLYHVDATASAEVKAAVTESSFINTQLFEEMRRRGHDEDEKKKRGRTIVTDDEIYDFFCGAESRVSVHSRCPFSTHEASENLFSLFTAIPYIINHWEKMHIRDFCRPYRRIVDFDPTLQPHTIIGLYVHLVFMTPTHLDLCLYELLRATSNETGT